jgi:DNA-binding CsgD family transcriptional regulator
VAVGAPLAVALTVATALGNHREAAALLRTPLPASMSDTQFGRFVLHARGHHMLAVGCPLAALECFQRCGDLRVGPEADLPALVPWRASAAQAKLVVGDGAAARELLEAQLALLEGDPRARGGTLRLLAATVPPADRIRLLHESIELLRESGDTLTLARALLDLSTTYGLTNDLGQAWQVAQRALQLAAQGRFHQFHPKRAEQAVEPATEEAAPGESGALSDAERRVVELARRGCTNREISARLHITVSTVEQHLTHAYRKLGVTRRSQLRTVLRAEATASAYELGELA